MINEIIDLNHQVGNIRFPAGIVVTMAGPLAPLGSLAAPVVHALPDLHF
jgi:hypothetical protein